MNQYSILLITFLLYVSCPARAESKAYAEAINLYNSMRVLNGQIVVINNPELGKTPASGEYILLQRLDCKKCLVGIRADANGYYKISLPIGKYRLIPKYAPQGEIDYVKKGQLREIIIRENDIYTEFNIELEIPAEDK